MPAPQPAAKVPLSALGDAIAAGWRTFHAAPGLSIAFAAVFAAIGVALVALLLTMGRSPLLVPAAGAFMLVGPALLAGYFRVAAAVREGRAPRWHDLVAGFREAPPSLWVLALVCGLLFMIWITDAGTLYSFMVGAEAVPLSGWGVSTQDVGGFLGWGAVMGGGLAAIIYVISAFSVPLLCARRAGLVEAVTASVRAVFRHFGVALAWALLLAVAMSIAILLLPLFVVVFPVLAYASEALYRRVFPVAG